MEYGTLCSLKPTQMEERCPGLVCLLALREIIIITLTYKAVHLKQPPSLAKHLKLKPMHFNTQNSDQLLLQHPPVGTNSYGRRAFSYTVPTVWNKVPDYVRNASSVMSFRKPLKTYYFGHLSRPPDDYVMSCQELL